MDERESRKQRRERHDLELEESAEPACQHCGDGKAAQHFRQDLETASSRVSRRWRVGSEYVLGRGADNLIQCVLTDTNVVSPEYLYIVQTS